MRTLTSGTLNVQAYDAQVWAQERNVLRIKDTGATVAGLFWPTLANKIAQYTLDENKSVEVDLTDFVRAHASGTQDVFVRTYGGAAQYVKADFAVIGLINPASILHPETVSGADIEPPHMILAQVGNAQTRVEVFSWSDTMFLIEHTPTGEREGIAVQGEPVSLTLSARAIWLEFFGTDGQAKKTTQIIQHVCGRTYAAVRWVSFTGQTRVHTWEVAKRKSETADAYELLTQDGSYNVVKGRKDAFSLRLEGLGAYDYWYYADVCHSSSVEVSFDGTTWQRAYVTAKGVTLPDGDAGKLNTLEVELSYRKYDAITL